MRRSRRAMRRVILTHLITHLKTQFEIELPEDFASRDVISDMELDAIMAFRSDHTLSELRAALARLEAGTFGACLGCKKPLRQEVLDEDPSARLCSECEAVFAHHLVTEGGTLWKSPQSPGK